MCPGAEGRIPAEIPQGGLLQWRGLHQGEEDGGVRVYTLGLQVGKLFPEEIIIIKTIDLKDKTQISKWAALFNH